MHWHVIAAEKVKVSVLLHVVLQPLAVNILKGVLESKHTDNVLYCVPYHCANLAQLRLIDDVWVAATRRSFLPEAAHCLIE